MFHVFLSEQQSLQLLWCRRLFSLSLARCVAVIHVRLAVSQ
jgi:hypothetical protein